MRESGAPTVPPEPAKPSPEDALRAKEEEAKRKKAEAEAETAKKKDAAAEAKGRKQAHREAEREAWTAALDLPAVIDNANAADFAAKARAALEGWYDDRYKEAMAANDKDRKLALADAKAASDEKLLEVLQKEAKKVAKEQELARNRDPQVHDDAFSSAFLAPPADPTIPPTSGRVP